MKFCYLYISDENIVKSGVDKKVEGKWDAIKKLFPESEIYFVTNNISSYKTIPFKLNNSKYFNSEYELKNKILAISEFIKQNNQFNYFILRYPSASKDLLELVKNNPKKIIFEHNTNESVELTISINKLKQQFPFKFKPSILKLYWSEIPKKIRNENKLSHQILEYAKAGICVTPEIERIEKNKFLKYNTICCSNGIDKNTVFNLSNKTISTTIKGIFIAGTYAEWHGIERIINSILNSMNKSKVELHFVGKINFFNSSKNEELLNSNIYLYPYMNATKLQEFMSEMHFSIGSCGMQKVGLTQGSVLKVREYLANGLPVIIGHHDPYISSIPELKKYCLEFPADESLLDFEKIIDFVTKLYKNNPNVNSEIQEAAFEHLSWEKTLKPLLSID